MVFAFECEECGVCGGRRLRGSEEMIRGVWDLRRRGAGESGLYLHCFWGLVFWKAEGLMCTVHGTIGGANNRGS